MCNLCVFLSYELTDHIKFPVHLFPILNILKGHIFMYEEGDGISVANHEFFETFMF